MKTQAAKPCVPPKIKTQKSKTSEMKLIFSNHLLKEKWWFSEKGSYYPELVTEQRP